MENIKSNTIIKILTLQIGVLALNLKKKDVIKKEIKNLSYSLFFTFLFFSKFQMTHTHFYCHLIGNQRKIELEWIYYPHYP